MTTQVFEVAPDEDALRLDLVVSRHLGESRSQAAKRVERGEVQVNGVVAIKSLKVDAGDTIVVSPPPEQPSGAAGVPVPPIRYEDEHLLVVAKPAGMVVHPGTGRPAGTLAQVLEAAGYPLSRLAGDDRPGIVHRLDRDTSGLLVVAKTDAAYLGLVSLLKRREVTRAYRTLVEGRMDAEKGRVDAPVGRDPGDRKRFAAVASGKPAVTHWRVLGTGRSDEMGAVASEVSLLDCRLDTGRTHQIRVHLSYAGHPVVGDRTYGASRAVASALGLSRPFLHAAELGFTHPITGEPVQVREPLPHDLTQSLRDAGIEPG